MNAIKVKNDVLIKKNINKIVIRNNRYSFLLVKQLEIISATVISLNLSI